MKTITVSKEDYEALKSLGIKTYENITMDLSQATSEFIQEVTPKKTKLDYAKEIPIGTLVKVWDDKNTAVTRYFVRVDASEFPCKTTTNTLDILSATDTWQHLSIAQGDWVFWQGGEQPIPDWMKIEIVTKGTYPTASSHDKTGKDCIWDSIYYPIIAYRIMEQELPND